MNLRVGKDGNEAMGSPWLVVPKPERCGRGLTRRVVWNIYVMSMPIGVSCKIDWRRPKRLCSSPASILQVSISVPEIVALTPGGFVAVALRRSVGSQLLQDANRIQCLPCSVPWLVSIASVIGIPRGHV